MSLQYYSGSPGPDIQTNMPLPSSFLESAFLDILSALEPLPDFPQRLATVNEQGQTLLHLAVHLRYWELVQKLIHWGIDPNVRDVNGFTAFHAASLCGDPFVVGVLKAGGATPFVLDNLGRPPTELTTAIPSTSRDTTREGEEIVPLAIGAIGRLSEQRTPLNLTRSMETQETVLESAAEGHPPAYVIFRLLHNQLLTHCLGTPLGLSPPEE
jgi:Ankyrin repeats (many copies)